MLRPLLYYLNRHIELDDTKHLPHAQQNIRIVQGHQMIDIPAATG
jgi:hypothetical protein